MPPRPCPTQSAGSAPRGVSKAGADADDEFLAGVTLRSAAEQGQDTFRSLALFTLQAAGNLEPHRLAIGICHQTRMPFQQTAHLSLERRAGNIGLLVGRVLDHRVVSAADVHLGVAAANVQTTHQLDPSPDIGYFRQFHCVGFL